MDWENLTKLLEHDDDRWAIFRFINEQEKIQKPESLVSSAMPKRMKLKIGIVYHVKPLVCLQQ